MTGLSSGNLNGSRWGFKGSEDLGDGLKFDEPLSNLDRNLRETLCREIGDLLGKLGITAIYVTHDHDEARALAHQIAHMDQGRITRITTA